MKRPTVGIRIDSSRVAVVPLRSRRREPRRSPRGKAADLLGALAAFALGATTVFCGTVGLVGLLGAIAGVSFNVVATSAGFLACLPLCLAATVSPRKTVWGLLATLVLCAAGLWYTWEPVAQQLGPIAEALFSSGHTPIADATETVFAVSALTACSLCCLALVANLGWTCALLCVPALLACPQIGCRPSALVVLPLLVYHAGALAFGRGNRRFQKALPSSVSFALALAALSFWGAYALVGNLAGPIAALPKAIDDRIVETVETVGGLLEERAVRGNAGDQSAGTDPSGQTEGSDVAVPGESGKVSRGSFDAATLGTVAEAHLSQQPNATLYLAGFHGSTYRGGVWEAESNSGKDGDPFAAQWNRVAQDLGLSHPVLTILSGSSASKPEELLPYARLNGIGPSIDGSAPGWAIVDFGSFGDLGAHGVTLTAASTEDVPSDWTQVPLDETPRLARLVADNPQPDLPSIVAFVRDTLAENAVYTTDPEDFPEDTDIAEHLVFDGHEGYCQHFATAATLMLRLYGIPARYVTGFALPVDAFALQEGGAWTAQIGGDTAHAWVEVYSVELGWVPVEVTPPNSKPEETVPGQKDVDKPSSYNAGPHTRDETAGSNVEEKTGERPRKDDGATGGSDDERSDQRRPAELAAFVAATAAALGLAAAWCALACRRRRAAARRARATADELMGELVVVLNFAGLLDRCTGSEDDLAQRLLDALPSLGQDPSRRIVEEAQRSAFGPEGPVPASAELHRAYQMACRRAREQLGPFGRLSLRYLHTRD